MNRNKLEERVRVGLEGVASAQFNTVRRLAGERGSNLQFIGSETGVLASIRGRGSGTIEPSTGRESNDPLHILLEHNNNRVALNTARRLVLDLVESVRDDWQEFQRHPPPPPPQSQPRGGESRRESSYEERQPQQSGRISYSEGSRHGADRSREDFRPPQEYGGQNYGNQYDDRWKHKGWDQREEGRSEAVHGMERERAREAVGPREDYYGNNGSRNYKEQMEQGGNSRSESFQQPQGREGDWNRFHGRRGQEDKSNWSNDRNRDQENARHWSYDQEEKNREFEDRKLKRKSRWDENKIQTADKGVMGVVLDQKKKIEEKLERVASFKGPTPSVSNQFKPGPVTAEAMVNPLLLSQEKLHQLNHRQLLEVSRQQQSLLLQLAADVSRMNSGQESKTSNHQGNMTTQSANQQSMKHQKEQGRGTRGQQDGYLSDDEDSPYRGEYAGLRNESEWDRGRRDESPPAGGKRWKENEQFKQQLSSSSYLKESWDPTPRKKNPSPWRGTDLYSPSQERYSPELDRYSPQLEDRHSPPRRGAERYSPKISSGQERYSPQLEDYYEHRNDPSEKLPRHAQDNMRYGWEKPLASEDPEKRRKDIQGFKVGVLDRNGNKLGLLDAEEIRVLVYKAQAHLDGNVPAPQRIDFVGLACNDFLYVLMPHTLQDMKWLVDLACLTSARGKKYILLPYDDIFNRYRMRAMLFYDMLDGYQPTEGEVLMELGRLNDNLNTDQWKVLKFVREDKAYFMMLTVDLLSYLQLRKIGWKPHYRTSFIRLEPTKSDKAIDKRFL